MFNLMRRIILARPMGLVLALVPFALAHAQDSNFVRDHYRKVEVRIPMRDGVRLFTSIYVPLDTTQRYPILLSRTPYSVRPYGPDAYRRSLYPSDNEAKEGFVFAYQDVRGRFMSEGEFVDIRPHNPVKRGKETDESSDTYDTVEWLVRKISQANGKVGISGISYPGFYSTMGVIDAHPALIAASPQAPIADWFIGDDDHHHGALFLAETFSFFVNFGRPRNAPTTRYTGGWRMPTPDAYAFFLQMGPIANAERLYMRDSVAYWKDLMAHPNYDEFWQKRSVPQHLSNIKPAVMTVGGWFDKEDLYGALSTYRAIEANNPGTFNILVMGPWSHGQWNRDDGDHLGDIGFGSKTGLWFREHVQLPFFNRFLKGKEGPRLAEAIVFETGRNEWHSLETWPPPGTQQRELYLRAGGILSFDPPGGKNNAYSAYVSDPAKPVPHTGEIAQSVRPTYMIEDQRFASSRTDVLVFESTPLRDPITVAGPLVATLFVSTTGTDADWVVKLIDVFPDDTVAQERTTKPLGGYQMLVRADVMRGRFRKSYARPEPFKQREVTRVEFILPDLFHTFLSRHKIMVHVQSSWFPLVDRNPQTFVNIHTASESDFRKAEHRVYHTPHNASHLKVGIVTLK